MRWKSAGPPLTDEVLASSEAEIGAKVPPMLIDFLRRFHNGGTTAESYEFSIDALGDSSMFMGFYGLGHPNDAYRLSPELVDMFRPYLHEVFPVGDDDLGNMLVLRVSGPECGAVCFWDLEDFHHNRMKLYHIADSLDAFIESLVLP